YSSGAIVRLVATPTIGYHLVQWTGDATGAANPLDIVMTADRSITPVFARNTYTLAVSVVGSGAVARSPDAPTYPHGTSVTLTATPDPHWHFAGWSGAATGMANPTAIGMTADTSVTATFAIDSFTVAVSAGAGGSVTRTPDHPSYAFGDTVAISATPGTGY